jgi:hypothetical protein
MTQILTPKPYHLPGHIILPEPALRFGSRDPNAIDTHPLKGLLQFGPFSRDKLAAVSDPIRIAMIVPSGQTHHITGLIREMEQRHVPQERKAYLQEFPGFSKIFGVHLAITGGACTIELPVDISIQMAQSPSPHKILADALTRAIFALRNKRHEFDVVLILLSKEWASGFKVTETEDFDLHDYLKAYAASEGICIQLLKEESALEYFCRCSVMWRLGIALYTKAGGVPWVLANVDPGTAFIGLDYALKLDAGPDSRYAICCSQVFDAEGSGLEFIAYEADGIRLFGKNPFLHREQMFKVMSRSLRIYQRKHAGESPKRIVVHKNTEFKYEEIEGCFDAFPNAENIELIHVQQECGWRGILIDKPKQPHGYPCIRGTTFQLGPYEALLWTQGNMPQVCGGKSFFKEGKGIPEPLLLKRYAGLGSIDDLCIETLALTKMDWNNDGLYDRLPVTLNFAQTLAKVVKRMPKLEPHSYPIRMFM